MGTCKKKKLFNQGRASGCALVGIKLNIASNLVSYSYAYNRIVIFVKSSDLNLAIIPFYLNCVSWSEEYASLPYFLDNLSDTKFMLMRDFNARIPKRQTLPDEFFLLITLLVVVLGSQKV